MGSILTSVIFRHWVVVRPGFAPATFRKVIQYSTTRAIGALSFQLQWFEFCQSLRRNDVCSSTLLTSFNAALFVSRNTEEFSWLAFLRVTKKNDGLGEWNLSHSNSHLPKEQTLTGPQLVCYTWPCFEGARESLFADRQGGREREISRPLISIYIEQSSRYFLHVVRSGVY